MTPAEWLEHLEENEWLHEFRDRRGGLCRACVNCGAREWWDEGTYKLCPSAKVDIRIFPLEETKVERGIEL